MIPLPTLDEVGRRPGRTTTSMEGIRLEMIFISIIPVLIPKMQNNTGGRRGLNRARKTGRTETRAPIFTAPRLEGAKRPPTSMEIPKRRKSGGVDTPEKKKNTTKGTWTETCSDKEQTETGSHRVPQTLTIQITLTPTRCSTDSNLAGRPHSTRKKRHTRNTRLIKTQISTRASEAITQDPIYSKPGILHISGRGYTTPSLSEITPTLTKSQPQNQKSDTPRPRSNSTSKRTRA